VLPFWDYNKPINNPKGETMKKLIHFFKTPPATDVALRQLAIARIDYLESMNALEASKANVVWNEAQVKAFQERINRLTKYLEQA
jgi:hypothetical protein